MAKELTDTIQENAQGPAEVAGDSGSMKQHPLKDQIEAATTAADRPFTVNGGRKKGDGRWEKDEGGRMKDESAGRRTVVILHSSFCVLPLASEP